MLYVKKKKKKKRDLLSAVKGADGGDSERFLKVFNFNVSEVCWVPKCWLVCIVNQHFHKAK